MAVATQAMPAMNGFANGHTNGHANGDVDMDMADGVPRFSTGLILPPPDIKSVIDRTATWVARSANPPQFEDKIRENQRNDPKFSFLNPADPYHAYYRHRIQRVSAGEADEPAAAEDKKDGEPAAEAPKDVGVEPPPTEFTLQLPNISAVDLDIMKLTALFTAQRGRGFLAALSVKEGRNYQFDFLRPTHSLFGYFNRLVEQYARVISPSRAMLDRVRDNAGADARWQILARAQQHAKWERNKREREQKREDEKEAERIAFAEIDWHDYAIVQTIEFTVADTQAELPAPMSLQQVESMTLAQKRMAALIHETAADDVEAVRARQAAEDEAAAAAADAAIAAAKADAAVTDVEEQERQLREEAERARAMQASSLGAGGPMKIRSDYVPKLGAKNKSATTTCTICGQQIAVDELQEHMRIELLDPRWKTQRDALEARKAQASELQRGADVVASLKGLARARVDLFGAEADEERRRRQEEEDKAKQREREKVVWDGHTASKTATQDRFSTSVNFDEQIAAIMRAKGLGPQEAGAMGPGIGTAAAPAPLATLPPAPASLPAPPHAAYSGAATVSSGPQPASAFAPPAMAQPPMGMPMAPPMGMPPMGMPPMGMPPMGMPGAPVMLPPLHFQGAPGQAGFGYAPGPQAGQVRSADQMDGADAPPAKRQKVAKLPGGQLYPEQHWLDMHPHPVTVQVQLPTDASKPEWKLEGQTITLVDVPLTLLVSTLRDRILQQTGSALGASKIRLSHGGKMLANANTIASYNVEEDDVLVLSVTTKKK